MNPTQFKAIDEASQVSGLPVLSPSTNLFRLAVAGQDIHRDEPVSSLVIRDTVPLGKTSNRVVGSVAIHHPKPIKSEECCRKVPASETKKSPNRLDFVLFGVR